jgi:putative transposase
VGISRSFYYYHIRYRQQRLNIGGRPIPGYSWNKRGQRISDEQIKEWLCEAIEGDCYNYGYVKLTKWLQREYGLVINKKKVYRLCKEFMLLKPQRRVKRKPPHRTAKKREITAPNQLWEIDIKYGYIAGEDRFFFIMSILDVYDRMIIDYHTGLSCTGRDAAYILSRACTRRSPEGKVVVRTDNGPQFISMAFETACEKLSVEHERIPNSSPNSNAHIEAFHSILEEDCLQIHEFEDFTEAYHTITEFMRYYNEVRLHSSIGYRPPKKALAASIVLFPAIWNSTGNLLCSVPQRRSIRPLAWGEFTGMTLMPSSSICRTV